MAWFSSPTTDSGVEQAVFSQQTTQGSQRRPPPSRKSANSPPFKRHPRNKLYQSSAVALFNDVVQRSGTTASGSSASSFEAAKQPFASSTTGQAQPVAASALDEWEITAKMQEISEMLLGPQEKLRLFQNDIWPLVKELRGHVPRHLYISTIKFLRDACDAVAEHGLTSDSLALSKMLATVGKWDLDVRNELVLNLCHILVDTKHPSAKRNDILEELLDMWKHLSQLKRGSQMHHHSGQQFVLPAVDEIMDNVYAASFPWKKNETVAERNSVWMSPTTRALSSIFVQFRPEQPRELIPGLLATLAVLSDPRLARDGSQIKAAPLLNLVSKALEHQPADESYVNDVFASEIRFPCAKLAELQSYVAAQWPQAMELVFRKDSAWRQGRSSSHEHKPSFSSHSHSSTSHSNLAIFHKQLRAAYESRNTGAVVFIWQNLRARLAQTPDLGRQLREDPAFLDFCIFVWCALRRSNKLQETLDVMQQVQIQPTVRTYTNMMHGWKLCKDAERIEALWQKLVESGLKLDAVIWTERISGLIEAGKPQAGIHALAEMQGMWKKAVASKGDAEGGAGPVAIQPTIEVVNAALKGLIALDRRAANEVLSWAGREGIEPNIRTFNILIRESFRSSRSGSPEDVKSLLRAMKSQGVEPDGATFTIIIEELLGGLESASAAEQVHVVEQILADIQAAGLRANLETYGKMLYAVSSLANGGADEAIAAVQQHMRADGFSATSHMVTILIERALSRDPLPSDTGATIRALLQEHRLSNINQGDQTLWERVMSAHAVTGDVPAAMDVFGQLARAGRPVTSLPCLSDLLKALLADRNAKTIADAKEVVMVVLNHKLERAAVQGEFLERDDRYWRHHFWFLAKENGLIDDGASVLPELDRTPRG